MTSQAIEVVEDVLEKWQKLMPDKQQQVLAFIEFLLWQQDRSIQPAISTEVVPSEVLPIDRQTPAWLEEDLGLDWQEYDWGEEGIPMGKSVRCVPGQGIVIVGVDGVGT